MDDQRLGRLLRELPEERAGAGFTARVLERLDRPDMERYAVAWRPRLAMPAIAMAALVALAISVGLSKVRHEPAPPDRAEVRQILEELRTEQERLEQDFEAMRAAAPEGPVLYLGGNEEIDLVVDLSNVTEVDGTVPAAYHPNETF